MFMTVLSWLFKFVRNPILIGFFLIMGISAGLGFVRYQQKRIAALKAEKAQLVVKNGVLLKENQTLGKQYQQTMAAYEALSVAQQHTTYKAKKVIKRLRKAPKSDNAPIAPVLRSALESIE